MIHQTFRYESLSPPYSPTKPVSDIIPNSPFPSQMADFLLQACRSGKNHTPDNKRDSKEWQGRTAKIDVLILYFQLQEQNSHRFASLLASRKDMKVG